MCVDSGCHKNIDDYDHQTHKMPPDYRNYNIFYANDNCNRFDFMFYNVEEARNYLAASVDPLFASVEARVDSLNQFLTS